jgi:hypothetical protein
MLEHLAIDLPVQHARFLSTFAKERGITISDTIDRLVVFLERTQERRPNADVMSLIGVLAEPPSMWDYLDSKYQ